MLIRFLHVSGKWWPFNSDISGTFQLNREVTQLKNKEHGSTNQFVLKHQVSVLKHQMNLE
jgi:hypothetical protein